LFKTAARIVLVAAVVAATAAALGATSTAASDRGSYIVVLRDSVASPAAVAQQQAARFGGTVTHVYSHALKGYSLTLPSAAASGWPRSRTCRTSSRTAS
jgi:subtilisin